MPTKRVLVKNGLSYLLDLYSEFKPRIMAYNEEIKDTGYYVKPMHVAYKNSGSRRVKYLYFGRYWYRVSRRGGRVVWTYLGKEKPEPSLPDPPPNPFENLSVVVLNESDVEVSIEGLELLASIERHTGRQRFFARVLEEASRARMSS